MDRVTEELSQLKEELPLVREQVDLVKKCYDTGQLRVRRAVSGLLRALLTNQYAGSRTHTRSRLPEHAVQQPLRYCCPWTFTCLCPTDTIVPDNLPSVCVHHVLGALALCCKHLGCAPEWNPLARKRASPVT